MPNHKITVALFAALMLCLETGLAVEPPPRDLVVLNWSEYMDPDIIARFEQAHNVKVKEIYFESDDTRDEMLVENDGRGYDLVLVNGLNLRRYHTRGWLAPITEVEVPNLKLIDPKWRTAFDAADGYAVPYFWGTLGIGYREDLVPEPITSWKQLYNPPEALRGKIVMNLSNRDLIGMGLKSLGYSANSTDPAELAAVEELLLKQQPFVREYSYVSLNEESSMVSGEILAAMLYSGDALMLQEVDERIAFQLPEEGGNLWVDYWVVLSSSKNKRLALDFIQFINEPETAAQLAEFVYYATPNQAAEKHLPAEFFEDPVIYPPEEFLERSEFFEELPPRTARRYNGMFANIVK
ncbi:MAG: spermidine/putrescine ABC transporter substrate-binding protein [Chromatiales bacterium]